MRAALVAVLVARGAAAQPTAAVVALTADVTPARIDAARQSLRAQRHLLEDAPKRRLLEEIVPAPSAAEEVRRALGRVPPSLRRFDLATARQELDGALLLAEHLPPTAESQALFAELALFEAEVALAQGDEPGERHALDDALAARADLELDNRHYPPPLRALFAEVRQARLHATRVELRVASQPRQVQVWLDGAARGMTPLVRQDVAAAHLVWLGSPGWQARMVRFDARRDARLEVKLAPLEGDERIAALVSALRAAGDDERPAAARALADALGVAELVTLGPGAMRTDYARNTPSASLAVDSPAPASEPRHRWWRRGWIWGVVGSVAVAGAVAGGVGGYYATNGRRFNVVCCQ